MLKRSRLAALAQAARVVACLLPAAAPAFAQHPGSATTSAPPAVASSPAPPVLRPVQFRDLPGWSTDRQDEALPALLATCDRLRDWPPDSPLGGAGLAAERAASPAAWRQPCAALQALAASLARDHRPGRRWPRRLQAWRAARAEAVRTVLAQQFEAYAVGPGLMTGYYEPVLRGAPAQGGAFRTPLYGRPPELAGDEAPPRRYGVMRDGQIEPFHARAAIEAGALAGRGLELAWVDDPVAAFFLHIQGSGRVVLPDGSVLRVGYAAQNGRAYIPIGRVLIERGEIPREQMSMQAIRAWLRQAGPDRAAEVMATNPSFVFFRRLDDLAPDQGPIGALGVPLTPQRSVAVDRAFTPLGLPLFVAARDALDGTPLARVVVAQDTGGAIRGPARIDFFWGWGEDAGDRAGPMREAVQVHLLLPRLQAMRRAAR